MSNKIKFLKLQEHALLHVTYNWKPISFTQCSIWFILSSDFFFICFFNQLTNSMCSTLFLLYSILYINYVLRFALFVNLAFTSCPRLYAIKMYCNTPLLLVPGTWILLSEIRFTRYDIRICYILTTNSFIILIILLIALPLWLIWFLILSPNSAKVLSYSGTKKIGS